MAQSKIAKIEKTIEPKEKHGHYPEASDKWTNRPLDELTLINISRLSEEEQVELLAGARSDEQRANMAVELQHSYGNSYVQRLLNSGDVQAETSPEGSEETKSNLSPGPYTGRRLRNDLMDPFEDKQNIFGPHIFKNYGKNRGLWEPLDGLIETYWVKNSGDWYGVKLETPELKKAAWNLVNGVCTAQEMAIIRDNAKGKHEEKALVEAIAVEHHKQYPPAKMLAENEYLKSNFRLYHEWAAVKFGFVSGPYAYFAKGK